MESRRVLSTGGPPLVAGLHPLSDPDGNGVVVRQFVAIRVETDPGTVVRLDRGADGSFEQARRVGRNGRVAFLARLAPGETTFLVQARDRDGATNTAEVVALRGDAVLNWNATFLRLTREMRSNPLAATRGLAMLHTAIYDAVNSIGGGFEAYAIDASAPRWASAESAAAAAGFEVMAALFPGRRDLLDASYREARSTARGGPAARHVGEAIGRAVGQAIVALRADDGSAASSDYVPSDEPGRWRPIPVRPGGPSPAGLAPHWGSVRPWAMDSNSQFRAEPPPALDGVAYAEALDEVKRLGAADSTDRTEDQTNIALFWSDDPGTSTPPGHWNRIAAEVASRSRNSLAENARLFALLNIATADAAIACWDTKYTYDLWRPYAAIREADTDGNPLTEADPTWEALIFIPPFPTYTSGHSTFSGASAQVLARYFGTDAVAFTSRAEGGDVPDRSFSSFTEAAAEAAASRLFGGIHFAFDNQAGLNAGTALGSYVFDTVLRPRA